LLQVSSKKMEKQKEIINRTFEDWRGVNEQIDDVLVMGIQIP